MSICPQATVGLWMRQLPLQVRKPRLKPAIVRAFSSINRACETTNASNSSRDNDSRPGTTLYIYTRQIATRSKR